MSIILCGGRLLGFVIASMRAYSSSNDGQKLYPAANSFLMRACKGVYVDQDGAVPVKVMAHSPEKPGCAPTFSVEVDHDVVWGRGETEKRDLLKENSTTIPLKWQWDGEGGGIDMATIGHDVQIWKP